MGCRMMLGLGILGGLDRGSALTPTPQLFPSLSPLFRQGLRVPVFKTRGLHRLFHGDCVWDWEGWNPCLLLGRKREFSLTMRLILSGSE